MTVRDFPLGPLQTNTYVVSCPKTGKAAIIDPAIESASTVIAYLEENKLTPVAILLTHSHWDHIADAALLKRHYSIPIFIHPLDVANLEQPGSDGVPGIQVEAALADHLIEEGDSIPVGHLSFVVLHTPGHTPGGVCFYCQEHALLFSGDTLFQGTIGNLSLPTANPQAMWSSLHKLAKLPLNTRVFPGHGPATSIGNEGWLAQAEKKFSSI